MPILPLISGARLPPTSLIIDKIKMIPAIFIAINYEK